MAGIVIFWFKKIDESERRKEKKTNGEKGEHNEGKDGEDSKDSGNATTKDTRRRCTRSYYFILSAYFISKLIQHQLNEYLRTQRVTST